MISLRAIRESLPAFFAVCLAACGTLVGNPEEEDGKGKTKPTQVIAPVVFSITDAPLDDAQSVILTVAGLEVSKKGDDWIKIPLQQEAEIDLLKYQDGESLPLAQSEGLEVGTYEKTRLILSSDVEPRLVLNDGQSEVLELKNDDRYVTILSPFTVEVGSTARLTIDFDLRKSIKKERIESEEDTSESSGGGALLKRDRFKYVLKPTLRMIRDDHAGAVSGTVGSGKTVCIYKKDSTKDDADDCQNSANSGKVKDGRYRIANLPEGEYEIRIFDEQGNVKDVKEVHVKQGDATEVDHD